MANHTLVQYNRKWSYVKDDVNDLFNLQLKERISTIGDGHQAELDGMKEQIANMTAELHKR